MNKLLIIGILLFLAGIAAYYFIDTSDHGIWIGALMGAGGILMISGISKKFG